MLKFELNIENRKDLAKRMEELTGIHPHYTRAPLYAYDIGYYTIDRDGNLLVEGEHADAELLITLMNEGLIRDGEDVPSDSVQVIPNFALQEPTVELEGGVVMIPAEAPMQDRECEETDVVDTQRAEVEEVYAAEDRGCYGAREQTCGLDDSSEEHMEVDASKILLDMVFEFPISQHNGVTLRNLINLIYSRGELISKATGGTFRVQEKLVEALKDDSCIYTVDNFLHAVSEFESQNGKAIEGLTFDTEKVYFTGFSAARDVEHLNAYGHLAILMNQQAISQKRIQAKDVNDANEKYALRTWLLRLGMNGPDFKQTRKILMENLSGHTAFRTSAGAEKFRKKEKTKRDALKTAKMAVQGGEGTEADAEAKPVQSD